MNNDNLLLPGITNDRHSKIALLERPDQYCESINNGLAKRKSFGNKAKPALLLFLVGLK
jgi:hypothetical protein